MTENINVKRIESLLPPAFFTSCGADQELLTERVNTFRGEIADIVGMKSPKKLCIVGPCSIHNYDSAVKYATWLKERADKFSDRLLVVMRVYFEKPRTTVGWKGFINDPDLDGSCNIHKGLLQAVRLLEKITEIGLPIACEFLDTISPQYLSRYVSWGAIGARTVESQLHRELASGLSMPIGFKNGTTDPVGSAINAVKSGSHPHVFLGVNEKGKASIVSTKGNKNCHVIYRGTSAGPNYSLEDVVEADERCKENGLEVGFVVDCSHKNCAGDYKKQLDVVDYIVQTYGLWRKFLGVMVESNLEEGKQKFIEGGNIDPCLSITDACVGLADTEDVLSSLHAFLNSSQNCEARVLRSSKKKRKYVSSFNK